ncbi:MAG: hypothetical protein ACREVL_01765 [Solimonas sp.]
MFDADENGVPGFLRIEPKATQPASSYLASAETFHQRMVMAKLELSIQVEIELQRATDRGTHSRAGAGRKPRSD